MDIEFIKKKFIETYLNNVKIKFQFLIFEDLEKSFLIFAV